MRLEAIFVKIVFMKFSKSRKIFFTAFLFAALFPCVNSFALPGVKNLVPDSSGQYVYYRDYSFKRESYIGVLFYDQSNYEARYFAPATESLPEKNIDLLFSVDPSKDHLELTGEYFVVPPQQDDVELVNYIHDLLYELTARRIKLEKNPLVDYSKNKLPFMEAGVKVSCDYEQFGGPVQMIYDEAVPIFNLKKIVDYSGNDALVLVTVGQIENSKDRTFAEFVPPIKKAEPREAFVIKSAKKEALSLRAEVGQNSALEQKVQADANWSLAGQSVWALGDSAILSFQTLALPADVSFSRDERTARFIRLFAVSKNYAYSDWSALDVHASASLVKISSKTYNPKNKKLITDIKTLSAAAQNFYGCFSLALYTDDYQANRGYFDKIAKSYSCKME